MTEAELNIEDEMARIDKELQESLDNARRTEYDGVRDVLKYFDRIHDKLFSFNNILIAGYFALTQLSESVSYYLILVPIVNLAFLLFIEYRMMEKSRFEASYGEKTEDDIKKHGIMISRTTNYSFSTIVSTVIVIIIFVVNLSASDSKFEVKKNSQIDNVKFVEKDTLENSKQKQNYTEKIIGAWTDNETENATIAFYADSMLYVDALNYVRYEIKSDTLIRYFDGLIDTSAILKLTIDSLIIESEYGLEEYMKFKK